MSVRAVRDQRPTRRRWRVLLAGVTIGLAGVVGGEARAVTPPALACLSSPGGATYSARSRPAACTILPPRASFSEGVNLTGLQWAGWGRPTATATGLERGFHLPYSRIAVRLTVYALRRDACGSGRLFYTRVRATSRYGTTIARPQAGCLGHD